MRTHRVLGTQAFRIVVVYLGIFALSAAALVGFLYWNTARVLDRETDDTIRAEVSGLVEQYQRLGLPVLSDVVGGRAARNEEAIYILADANRHVIAGNLDSWPSIATVGDAFVEFEFERRQGDALELRQARGQVFTLQQGYFLLVARDVHDRRDIQRLFATALPWSIAWMFVLGIGGGIFISRRVLARLEVINRTSRQIIAGDLSKRIPVSPTGDEFDDLSGHLNRMLDRIERLMHGMREVSDNVAHDLRSPLNRLRSRLEALSRHQASDPEMKADIDATVEETDRLINTFNALLLIAETEAGSVRETMSDFDLSDAMGGICDLYEPVAEDAGLAFAHHDSGPGVTILGNQNLISQALANIVDNAIKYTPSGGKITVSAELSASGVDLVVADTGPGIAPEDRGRVTERFVRLEASRNSPGTGLGLSLVAAVARLHNGALILEDNKPGLRAILRLERVMPALRGLPLRPSRSEMLH